MKKVPDISKNVMDQVVRFEEDRSRQWYVKFSLMLLGLIGIIGGGVIVVWNQFSQNQTFELFTLLNEDWEIISEYWKDTLGIIWEEAPQDIIIIALSAIVVAVAIVILSRPKRKQLEKVRRQVNKYRKRG
jgi:cytochrome bd-type quinol oxidase subunit 2